MIVQEKMKEFNFFLGSYALLVFYFALRLELPLICMHLISSLYPVEKDENRRNISSLNTKFANIAVFLPGIVRQSNRLVSYWKLSVCIRSVSGVHVRSLCRQRPQQTIKEVDDRA